MILSFCIIFIPSLCNAWGNLAHRTIALLAQKHLTQEALEYTKDLLGSETIDSAAIWADAYKLLPQGRKTGSWHFVDAQDDPPNSCSLDYHRDCQPNRTCIIDAIRDMTGSMVDATASPEERKRALKFILHLIGDIHCPLHAESIARGGNDITVMYRGKVTNLHFVWDVYMPRDVANGEGEDEVEVAKRWAEQLYNSSAKPPDTPAIPTHYDQISLGVFMADFNAINSRQEHVLGWAREANALVCAIVLQDGVEAIRNKELSGEYFKASAAVIQRQIALSGVRLAMWINSLVANSTGATEEGEESK